MSDKWRRSKAWDDEHLTGALWPAKVVLRAFSSIPLAVCLLLTVALYGILASVPVGLLVYGLSFVFYALTLLGSVAVGAVVPAVVVSKATARLGRGGRFLAVFGTFVVLAGAVVAGWVQIAWPVLHYDPAAKSGVRFFGSFVDAYSNTTLRRLPFMEMSELEFYAWWPLRAILLTFVINMVIATVRRIEFTFRNIGVLTVHTGIVVITLGSVYYSGLKLEGDMLLRAGNPNPAGQPTPGPPEAVFYDNTRSALYIDQDFRGFEARQLARPPQGLPRYNNYGLELVGSPTMADGSASQSLKEVTRQLQPWKQVESRSLSSPVVESTLGLVDPDISFRLVGYSPYCEPVEDWVRLDPPTANVNVDAVGHPLRVVYLHSMLGSDGSAQDASKPAFSFPFVPDSPVERVKVVQEVLGLEYTLGPAMGMSESRWRDLNETLPAGTRAAIVVEIPAKSFRGVYAVEAGQKVDVGDTGYRVEVKDIAAQPPFPIITKGYQNASSSVAVVRVIPPIGEPFERWVYHRFPEISQDMLSELNERGMPKRRDADPSVRISFIDASVVQVYFDEPDRVKQPGVTRVLVRRPGESTPTVIAALGPKDRVPFDEKVWLQAGERWDNAERVERPSPVPAAQQTERQAIGTHERSMLAVEISVAKKDAAGAGQGGAWKRVVWLPFAKYLGLQSDASRKVVLPDGRRLTLSFGRLQHRLPGFEVALVDFQMIAYDHRGAPRDYQSVLRVAHTGDAGVFGATSPFDSFEHVTKLNAPLRAPFHWDDARPWVVNFVGQLANGLSPRQFKFSQAGWDAGGWEESQKLVDQGLAKRPHARYTILGVGNNPGIHVIAGGAILMGLGIPWAFYVKPWLVQREKRKIQAAIAAGTFVPPVRGKKGGQASTVVVKSNQSEQSVGGASTDVAAEAKSGA